MKTKTEDRPYVEHQPPGIKSPGRQRVAQALAGHIVHHGVGQAKRGEYGTPRPERPREIRRKERGDEAPVKHPRARSLEGTNRAARRARFAADVLRDSPDTKRNAPMSDATAEQKRAFARDAI